MSSSSARVSALVADPRVAHQVYFNFEDGRSGLVTAARRMHLLHSFGPYDLGPAASPAHEDPSLSEEVRFSAYVQEEERLRLGWGIYVRRFVLLKCLAESSPSPLTQYFDTQASSLLNLKPLFAISEISLTCRLPDAEDRFSTSSAAAWAASPATSPPHFRTVMEELLTKNRSERSLSPFGLSIVAVSLYR